MVQSQNRLNRARMRALSIALTGLALGMCGVGCQGDRNFSIFGYTTAPPFDPNIRSVYIPVIKNTAFHTSPYRGIEADLTQAIVDELNRRRSPIRVVSDPSRADTELVGTIVQMPKYGLNLNLQNQIREFNIFIGVDVVWRDLKTGKVLSGVRRKEKESTTPEPFDPNIPGPAPTPPEYVATPVRVTGRGRVFPELGETNATGTKMALEEIARQIVNMMEQPW